MSKPILPTQVEQWIVEVNDTSQPIWNRDVYCQKLESLKVVVDKEIMKFKKEQGRKVK